MNLYFFDVLWPSNWLHTNIYYISDTFYQRISIFSLVYLIILLYYLLMASITNYHKFGSLKQHKCIFLQPGGQKPKVSFSGPKSSRVIFPPETRGGANSLAHAPSSSIKASRIVSLSDSASLCFPLCPSVLVTWPSFLCQIALYLPFIGTLEIAHGAHPVIAG